MLLHIILSQIPLTYSAEAINLNNLTIESRLINDNTQPLLTTINFLALGPICKQYLSYVYAKIYVSHDTLLDMTHT